MSRIKFGTDGVRGVANRNLRPEDAFALGMAAGRWLMAHPDLSPRVVMGRDTRRSGTMLGAALAAGFNSAGVEVSAVGVVPTGCVSFLARTEAYGMGVVISASHNPAPDNGIKLLAHDGKKLTDKAEQEILALLDQPFDDRPLGGRVGLIEQGRLGVDRYLAMLQSIVPERLEGLRVAIDGAHGAAHELGAEIFRRLGAEVVVVGDTPDGVNINAEGGATKPETIQRLTQQVGATVGVAFDGDADRAVFADAEGRLINGDRTMAIWAAHWRSHGQFEPPILVGTVMSNGGFEAYAREQGIQLERADVGDKHVSRRMNDLGAKLGGEQSGHLIFAERGPTGDGLITALELCRVLKREGICAATAYGAFENYPQLLVNVEVANKEGWDRHDAVLDAQDRAAQRLGPDGRLNVRASGTQPMIRVMCECPSEADRDAAASEIVDALLAACGGRIYSKVDLTYALGD